MPVLLIINRPRRKSVMIPKVREIKAIVGGKKVDRKTLCLRFPIYTMHTKWNLIPFLKEQAET